jgi:hypothetical protein
MSDADWLLGDPRELRDGFAREVERVLGRWGIREYDSTVPDFFLDRLDEKRDQYWREQQRLPEPSRRGIDRALASVDAVVEDAAATVIEDKDSRLRLAHIRAAYQRKFCQIWPFC